MFSRLFTLNLVGDQRHFLRALWNGSLAWKKYPFMAMVDRWHGSLSELLHPNKIMTTVRSFVDCRSIDARWTKSPRDNQTLVYACMPGDANTDKKNLVHEPAHLLCGCRADFRFFFGPWIISKRGYLLGKKIPYTGCGYWANSNSTLSILISCIPLHLLLNFTRHDSDSADRG